MSSSTELFVPLARLDRWLTNFLTRHGPTATNVVGGALIGLGQDGSRFEARLPFGRAYAGSARTEEFCAAGAAPPDWGVLLVRKGGFAVARLHGDQVVDSKVGQRHVQGRTKAGGQSQQRFARRRDNQARAAYDAAAGHAHRILAGVPELVTGGDHAAVAAALEAMKYAGTVSATWLAVPDPRRRVLEDAIADARSVRMSVTNT